MRYSVIVPVYNVEKYLHQCVDSILNQTFRDFELILVDDGSPDGCPAICDEYAEKDDRVVVIHKENGGQTSARRAGASRAQGEYIALIDGDDWVSEDWLQEVQAVLTEKTDIDVLCYDYYQATVEKNIPVHSIFSCGYYDRKRLESEIYPRLLRDANGNGFRPSIWGKVFAKDMYILYQNQVDEQIRVGEDECVSLACVFAAESIFVLDKCLYFYRQRENSIMRTRNKGYPWLDIQLRKAWHERVFPLEQYDFQNQLNRLIVNELFTYAKSHLRTTKPYREVKKEIISEFSRKEYQEAIRTCIYKRNWKKFLVLFSVRRRQVFLIYLFARFTTS